MTKIQPVGTYLKSHLSPKSLEEISDPWRAVSSNCGGTVPPCSFRGTAVPD